MGKYKKITDKQYRKVPVSIDWIKTQCEIDPRTNCWNWKLCRDPNGYGRIRFRNKPSVLSRVVMQLSTGEEGDGMEACHSCDNPPCCNPEHLRWGTRKQNAQEAADKGRMIGWKAKLSTLDVWHIRRRDDSTIALARLYSLRRESIRRVIKRLSYRHIPEEEGSELLA